MDQKNMWALLSIISQVLLTFFTNSLVKCEVLLLADGFEKIKDNSLKIYRLSHYYLSGPGLSWDAMLKLTKMKLELERVAIS